MRSRLSGILAGLLSALLMACRAPAPEIVSKLDRPVAGDDQVRDQSGFGLVVAGQYGLTPPGVTCFTPWGHAPRVAQEIRHGDVYDDALDAQLERAARQNVAVVSRTDYPDADLCRPERPEDREIPELLGPVDGPGRMTLAARSVNTPPDSLHAAARRGGAAEIRRFLRGTPADEPDGLGLTALSWAVARDRAQAVDILLAAGADPDAKGSEGRSALHWAAALGREATFRKLLAGKTSPVWSRIDFRAALLGGNAAILRRMLADPHEPIRPELMSSRDVSAESLEILLETGTPGLADGLLDDLTSPQDAVRTDLIALAIRHGADVNATQRYKTPLGAFSNGIYPRSPQAVRMLLAAGADPNALSHRRRPIWEAVGVMKLDGTAGDSDARALEILDLLIEAGGDINLPDYQGRPPAWVLFFPRTYDHEAFDPSFITKDLLSTLKTRGLDLNAPWNGRRLLAAVEAKAGPRSEQAIWLRELGARG